VTVAIVVIVAVAGLAAVYALGGGTRAGGAGQAGEYAFAAGEPGPGEQAPGFALPATGGGTVALDDYRGERVLLYFQEGLMCQPCWDQITDIEARWDDFESAGVDRVVSITTDPIDALRQKVDLEGITSPVLSDPDLAVSRQYDTNSYGMMGGSHNGHSFILVGPDGEIRWRADYGGAPDYTMYLPVDNLLADLRAGQGA
jgi:peroxiredoxin Q/BCP